MSPGAIGEESTARTVAQLPCLLVNPRSFRASRRDLAGRATRLARQHGLAVHAAADAASVCALLDVLRECGQQQIWVLAGDGTLQIIAAYLAARQQDSWTPALLPLAGGRANIVPRDCGGYPAMPKLRAALAALRAGRPLAEERILTLQVSQAGAPPRQGFLLAGGVIQEGVRLCTEHRERGTGWLHRSWLADPYTLLKLAVQVTVGRSPLPPYPDLDVRLPNGGRMQGQVRLLLAASLQLRNALYDPFAARGEGPVRVTAVAATARKFWRKLPAMLGGRFDDEMVLELGYLSGRCARAEVHGVAGYALDGEYFTADPSLPLELAAGIELRVLRP